jgi:3',5'-cyclic AMP phosphodiesterase CpdA
MKNLKFLYLLLLILIATSCTKDQWFDSKNHMQDNFCNHNLISPKIKIAVVSDIHYMDPSIAPDDPSTNSSFEADVSFDRKIFELSDRIFRKVISDLKAERPDILLVTGDLAKDGELIDHEAVKGSLQKLEKAGIKVYVIPGNNDINNAGAKSYKTDPATPVASISEDQFTELYGDFGYDEALYRDPASLSYICQPHRTLWILGIDGVKRTGTDAEGEINAATLSWIDEKMTEAREKNITVLAMMHYGIIEHYAGQNNLESLINNYQESRDVMMNSGIRLIFTGHYHANDIVQYSDNGISLTDIQTGSLVTPPYSYRIMTLGDKFINIDTRRVTDVRSEVTGSMNFLTYSDVTLTSRLNSMFTYYLRGMFGIPKTDAISLAPYVTDAFKAYFAGDEEISSEVRNNIDAVAQGPYPFMADILNSVWTDLPPQDNEIQIKLK